MRMKKILLLVLIFITGCTGPGKKPAESSQKLPVLSHKNLQGNWLVKDYFDKLNSGGYAGSISASGYGITEVRIDSALHDSLWLFNEDDYTLKVPYKLLGDDSIRVRISPEDSACISFHPKTGVLDIKSLTHERNYTYFHAADTLLSGEMPPSAFRKALDCAIARTSFIVYDPRLDQPHGVSAMLDCSGNVHGLKNFKTYRIFVNEAKSDCRGIDRIDFSDGKKTYSFGMVLVKNGIFLYHLNQSGKSKGKRYYQKGDFYLELDRVVKKPTKQDT